MSLHSPGSLATPLSEVRRVPLGGMGLRAERLNFCQDPALLLLVQATPLGIEVGAEDSHSTPAKPYP